jgi:hypothetical protein
MKFSTSTIVAVSFAVFAIVLALVWTYLVPGTGVHSRTHASGEESISDYFLYKETSANRYHNTTKYEVVLCELADSSTVREFTDSLTIRAAARALERKANIMSYYMADSVAFLSRGRNVREDTLKSEILFNTNIRKIGEVGLNMEDIKFYIYKVMYVEDGSYLTRVDVQYFFLNENNEIIGMYKKDGPYECGYFCKSEKAFYDGAPRYYFEIE